MQQDNQKTLTSHAHDCRFSTTWLLGLCISVIVAALSIAFACHGWIYSSAVSDLVPSSEVIEFGAVSWGMQSREFTLTNMSGHDLRIERVVTSCDCAKVLIPDGLVRPNDGVTGTVRWDTRGKHGPSDSMFYVAYSAVEDGEHSRVSEKQRVALRLTGSVEPDFNYYPERLVFLAGNAQTGPNDIQSQKVVIVSSTRGQSTQRMLSVQTSHPAFTATLADDKGSAKITFEPSRWRGRGMQSFVKSAEVTITTNNEYSRTLRIPIAVKDDEHATASVNR